MSGRLTIITALLAVLFILNIIFALAAKATTEPRPNPFYDYTAYMPGSDLFSLKGCQTWATPYGFYAVCTGDEHFDWIRAVGMGRTITATWFYPAPGYIKLPDMMAWYGKWRAFYRGLVYWSNGMRVEVQRWHGMQSDVRSVYFDGT